MGLDQSALIVINETGDDEQYSGLEGWVPCDEDPDVNKFYWRKHARLQVFMSKQYAKQKPGLVFNGQAVVITDEVLDELEEAIATKYCDYFATEVHFWGHQFQEASVKEYEEKDKRFLAWAREQVKNKKNIIYTCSW